VTDRQTDRHVTRSNLIQSVKWTAQHTYVVAAADGATRRTIKLVIIA